MVISPKGAGNEVVINITKIAKDNNKQKHLDRYFKSDKWNEICNTWQKSYPPQKRGGLVSNPYYVINSIGKCETYGIYIHPDLIHFPAEWCIKLFLIIC